MTSGAAVTAAMANQAVLLDLALAPRGLAPSLVEAMETAGPFGMGWPGPRIAVGPVRLVKADLVGTDHVRLIVRGESIDDLLARDMGVTGAARVTADGAAAAPARKETA